MEKTAENKKTERNERTEPVRPPRSKDFIPFPSHSNTGKQKQSYTLQRECSRIYKEGKRERGREGKEGIFKAENFFFNDSLR